MDLSYFGWTSCDFKNMKFWFVVYLTNRLRNIISYKNWIKSGCISHLPKNFRLINCVYELSMVFTVAVPISNRLSSIMLPNCNLKPIHGVPLKGFDPGFLSTRDTTQISCTRIERCWVLQYIHYTGVIMGAMAYQITSLTIAYSTVYSGTDERKHQSSASLAFMRGIHRWPVNSPHKGPVTWKMFLFDDVIMLLHAH